MAPIRKATPPLGCFLPELIDRYSTREIREYLDSIIEAYEKLETTRFTLGHEKIQEIVADYLTEMKWNVKFETTFADFNEKYKFIWWQRRTIK